MRTYTAKFEKVDFDKVRSFFEERNAEFGEQQYAVFRAKIPQCVGILFESGKFVLQGKDVSEVAAELQSELPFQQPVQKQATKPQLSELSLSEISTRPHIGVDESGKGDFFGPLVIAGVLVDEENSKKFTEAGVKDSKKLSDEKILKLANLIKANSVHSIVVVGNEKYNEIYAKFENLNKLLAWGHARVIENVLEKRYCDYALSDKFGNEYLIKNALLEKGKTITLDQRTHGEEDIAVAAASVLARAAYVNKMQVLSRQYEIVLPKGASDAVLQAGKNFVQMYGKEKLKAVAKIHFKTFNQI